LHSIRMHAHYITRAQTHAYMHHTAALQRPNVIYCNQAQEGRARPTRNRSDIITLGDD